MSGLLSITLYRSYISSAKAKEQLPRFVYKVLELHQGKIKSFTLAANGIRFNESDVVSWINTVVSRGVEILHLDIDFSGGTDPKWPLSVFTCKTLVDLKIWSLYGSSMDTPSTPIFPCLKKLQLEYLENGFFTDIVSRCLALEHFIVGLDGAQYDNDIVSSSVKRLDIDCDTSSHSDQTIGLCVPSLEYLKMFCALPFDLIAEEQLSSLIEADIGFCEYLRCYSQDVTDKELRDSFVRFIEPITNVKFLRLDFRCDKFFNSVGDGLFVNLTKLEIVSSFFEWRLLLSFMESSINLEAIILEKTSTLKKHKVGWRVPKKVPTSLSSSLRKLSIHGYSEKELPMVKYVLRTAQILEQVDIHCAIDYQDNNDLKSKMLRNLQKFPRACERCEIILV